MAIALVGSPATGSAGGVNDTVIAASAFNLITGNGVIVGVKCEGVATIDSVTDTAGNTYTGLTAATYTTNGVERMFYCANATGNASNVVTGNFSASIAYRGITVWQVSGQDTGAGFLVDSDTQTGSGTTSMTSPSITAGDAAFFFIGEYAGTSATPGSGWTESADDATGAFKAYYRIDSPGGTYAASGTLAASTNYGLSILSIASGTTSTLEQKRFRWRNDDGSESTATWAAAEDTNITEPLG